MGLTAFAGRLIHLRGYSIEDLSCYNVTYTNRQALTLTCYVPHIPCQTTIYYTCCIHSLLSKRDEQSRSSNVCLLLGVCPCRAVPYGHHQLWHYRGTTVLPQQWVTSPCHPACSYTCHTVIYCIGIMWQLVSDYSTPPYCTATEVVT